MLKIKFNKKFYKITFLLLLPVIAFFVAYILIKNGIAVCIWKNIFHIDCWGCGITRAFYALCHFDFKNAWHYNNKIFIIAPLLIYIWVNEIIKACKKD